MYTIILCAILGGVFGANKGRRNLVKDSQGEFFFGDKSLLVEDCMFLSIIFAMMGIGVGMLAAGFAGSLLPRTEVHSSFTVQCTNAPACQLPTFETTAIRQIEDPTLEGHDVLNRTVSQAVVPPGLANWVIVGDTENVELRVHKRAQ